MIILAIISHIVLNIVFYILNNKRSSEDQFIKKWCTNNINYVVWNIFKYSALVLAHKWYRLCYSRLFNLLPLSTPYRTHSNVFPLATVFTIITLLACEIPAIVAAFSLVYLKLLKDQMFYSCVECLIVTVIAALVSLIDIHKADDYFEES